MLIFISSPVYALHCDARAHFDFVVDLHKLNPSHANLVFSRLLFAIVNIFCYSLLYVVSK